jgi:hypothetical protein|tara:strand:+ start:103 stop:378 length:276 start_codon:yes stop_codon:yes gene_type:complete
MKKILGIIVLGLLLSGCAAGNTGTTSGTTFEGQWTEAQEVGPNKYLITGWASQEAMDGAKEFCSRTSKKYNLIELKLASGNTASRLLFSCY